jgi:hypothetical protein
MVQEGVNTVNALAVDELTSIIHRVLRAGGPAATKSEPGKAEEVGFSRFFTTEGTENTETSNCDMHKYDTP